MFGATSQEKAYIAPFVAFMGFLALNEIVGKIFDGVDGAWWMSEPRFWVFPLQTLVCGWLLCRWWRFYELKLPNFRSLAIATGIGLLVLILWVAPQIWFGVPARRDGFDPTYFGTSGWAFGVTVALRFLRLAVVVPLVEEIFWRGYLLRILTLVDAREILRSALESLGETLHEFHDRPTPFRRLVSGLLHLTKKLRVAIGSSPAADELTVPQSFNSVPIGAFTWFSFCVVTAGFCLEHQPADWPAAILAGMLYNFVAYRTRSLTACVLAHAVTNLLLGIFVMRTGQWGFW